MTAIKVTNQTDSGVIHFSVEIRLSWIFNFDPIVLDSTEKP